jgi:hypothetical protein
MKLLLTGSDGFVGSLLKRERPCVPLLDDGCNVDLRDADRLRRAVVRIAPDAVVHLAAQSFVPESFARPRETYEINFFGTLNLLEALKAASFAGWSQFEAFAIMMTRSFNHIGPGQSTGSSFTTSRARSSRSARGSAHLSSAPATST